MLDALLGAVGPDRRGWDAEIWFEVRHEVSAWGFGIFISVFRIKDSP